MPTIYVARESSDGETRVAASPETVRKYLKEGFEVAVQRGAGERSNFSDSAYETEGARTVDSIPEQTHVHLSVSSLDAQAVRSLPRGALAIGLLAPHQNDDLIRALRDSGISAIAMELIPRITRAQSMDVLSSQASIGGYKAVLLAASRLGKYFPLLMTAAGTIKPARVVIMGAGVAGLQAVATAKRLGAIVEVSDIRPAVKEQVESLGGRFIELPMEESGEGTGGYAKEMGEDFLKKQREIVARHVAAADVVITTAQIPGRKAPMLVNEEMVESMRDGAVIVDMAVASGGNCALSRPDEEVTRHGVHILGPSNLPATVPEDASTLFSRNVLNLILSLKNDGEIVLDREDEVVAGALVTHDGAIVHEPTAERLKEEV